MKMIYLLLFTAFISSAYTQSTIESTIETTIESTTESIDETTVPPTTTTNESVTTKSTDETTVPPTTTTTESITTENTDQTTVPPTTTTTKNITTESTDETTVPPTTTTTDIPVMLLSDYADTYVWSPRSKESIVVEAAEGYKISVNITDCNIDGKNGEYATISTDEYTNGLTFTYTVKNNSAYLYNTNRLLGDFFGTNASNFTAVFSRIGEPFISTTTELPTTAIDLPIPSENDSSTLVVYIAGKRPIEYRSPEGDGLNLLIDAIAAMAAEYCENENFPLNGTVTTDNVIIQQLAQCSINWPETDTCVMVNFSVPVLLREDTTTLWTGYQMTTKHLEIMWARYATVYLPEGMTIYSPPDTSKLRWGIVIASAVIGVLFICLLVIRHYGMKVSKMMSRRKLSDVASIISANDRNSQISLPPHYLQETPALFENAYPMYNPDKSPTYTESGYTKAFDYSDYQDDLAAQLKEPDENDLEESGA